MARRASTPAYVQLCQSAAVTSERLHASQPELLATAKNWHSWGTARVEKPRRAGLAASQEALNSVGPSQIQQTWCRVLHAAPRDAHCVGECNKHCVPTNQRLWHCKIGFLIKQNRFFDRAKRFWWSKFDQKPIFGANGANKVKNRFLIGISGPEVVLRRSLLPLFFYAYHAVVVESTISLSLQQYTFLRIK